MFSLEKRFEIIKSIFAKQNNVKVQTYKGLTVDFCKK